MNNFLKKISIKDTIISIICATIAVFAIATFFELELLFRCEKKVNFEELNMKNLSKFCTIEQLEILLANDKKNTSAHIKLADIYNSLNENSKANFHYKEALRLSSRSNFALYKYALFLANNNMINLSTSLAEEISGNNLKTYEYRAKIYELIAQKLNEQKEFEGENKSLQVAYKYAKNMEDKKYLDKIATLYAQSYVNLADVEIEKGKVDEAIFLIKNSFKIKKTPLGCYKLGLIYKDDNPKQAERLFSFAMRENPYIVNPYIYNKLLEKLYSQANMENSDYEINYYSIKLNSLKKALKEAYLYKNDLSIKNVKIIKDEKSKAERYLITFDIKNNSKENLEKLIMNAEIIINQDKYNVEDTIIKKSNFIPFLDERKSFNLKLPREINIKDLTKNDTFILKFFAKKDKKAPWTLLGIKQIIF